MGSIFIFLKFIFSFFLFLVNFLKGDPERLMHLTLNEKYHFLQKDKYKSERIFSII